MTDLQPFPLFSGNGISVEFVTTVVGADGRVERAGLNSLVLGYREMGAWSKKDEVRSVREGDEVLRRRLQLLTR